METKLLREYIEESIDTLIPFFEITEKELEKFEKFAVIRKIPKARDYENHSERVPAYSYIDNFFYFPHKNGFQNIDVFYEQVINHEVGHYIHNQINPIMKEMGFLFLENKEKEKLPDYKRLKELIAEYGNLILSVRDENDAEFYKDFYKNHIDIYNKYGSNFLPDLARMDLEKARKIGIIDMLKN